MTIRTARYRKNQSRRNKISKLKTGMVLTMAKHGHLNNVRICIPRRLEHLREHRVSYIRILLTTSAITDDHAPSPYSRDVVLQLTRYILNCVCIHRDLIRRPGQLLNPHPANNANLIPRKQSRYPVQKHHSCPPALARAATDILRERSTLDLVQDPIKRPRTRLPRMKPVLLHQKSSGQVRNSTCIHNQTTNHHRRRNIRTAGIWETPIARLVHVTDLQTVITPIATTATPWDGRRTRRLNPKAHTNISYLLLRSLPPTVPFCKQTY